MRKFLLVGLLALPTMSIAENFTTAAEVRPILEATKASWVAVREFDGKDLLYFTQVLSWRCGLSEIRYGLNGAAATEVLAMEPCHKDTAAPNALTMDSGTIYLSLPLQSVQSVVVQLYLNDGAVMDAQYERKSVLMP